MLQTLHLKISNEENKLWYRIDSCWYFPFSGMGEKREQITGLNCKHFLFAGMGENQTSKG